MHLSISCPIGRWLAALVLFYSTAIASFSTVICVQENGSQQFEMTVTNGRCAPCSAELRNDSNFSVSAEKACVDLPILTPFDSKTSQISLSEHRVHAFAPIAVALIRYALPLSITHADSTGTITPVLLQHALDSETSAHVILQI